MKDRQGAIAGAKTAARFGWKIGDRIPIKTTIFGGANTWEFNLDGIYHSDTVGGDESQFWFQWDAFEEGVPKSFKDNVGWYVLKLDSPDDAVRVGKAIDDMFANSSFETKTETESAFAAGWVKQFGNIEFLILTIGAVVFFTLLLVTGNTMAISVRERIGELAVLKAIGFSDRSILFFVLAESLTIALVGGLLGLGLAALAIPVLAAALNGLAADADSFAGDSFRRTRYRSARRCRQRPVARNRRHAHAGRQCASEGLNGYSGHLQRSQRKSSVDLLHRRGPGHRRHRRRVRRHAFTGARLSGPRWSPPVPTTTPSSCAPAPLRK